MTSPHSPPSESSPSNQNSSLSTTSTTNGPQKTTSTNLQLNLQNLRSDLSLLKSQYKQLNYDLKQFLSEEILMKIFNYFIGRVNEKLRKQKQRYEVKMEELSEALKQNEVNQGRISALEHELGEKVAAEQTLYQLNQALEQEKASLVQEREALLNAEREAHEKALQDATTRHQEALETEQREHDAAVKQLKDQFAELQKQIEQERQDHAAALEAQQNASDLHLELSLKEHAEEVKKQQEDALIAAKEQWEQDTLQPQLDRIAELEETLSEQGESLQQTKDMITALTEEQQTREIEYQEQMEHLQMQNQELQETVSKLKSKVSEQETLISKDARISDILQRHEKALHSLRSQRNKWRRKSIELELAAQDHDAKVDTLAKQNEKLIRVLQHHDVSLQIIDEELVETRSDTIAILNRIIQKLNTEVETLELQKKKQLKVFRSRERDLQRVHEHELGTLRKEIHRLREGALLGNDSSIGRTMLTTYEEKYRTSTIRIKKLEDELAKLRESRQEDVREAISRITTKYRTKIERLESQLGLRGANERDKVLQERDAMIAFLQTKYNRLEKDYQKMVDELVR